jgi:hypothetical protein
MTAAAVRARRYRQRRKNAVRCLVVEISRVEIQALVKAVQTQRTDADVKHAIHALLNASYMTGGADRGRTAGTQSSQAVGDGESCCAWCGLAGVVGYGPGALLPAKIRGEHFVVHSHCFEVLAAARTRRRP